MLKASFLLFMVTGMQVTDDRINLVDFARVVEYRGDTPDTLEVYDVQRGKDGWPTWIGEDGQRMIGIEWDEPRDVAEVSIEFRHAIANRDEIRIQYWQNHWPTHIKGGWAPLDDPFHGRWVDAKTEWWAGDRDVSFAFVPYNQEQPGDHAPDVTYRRTYRLRFVCGQQELPPVKYLRAFGLSDFAEAEFDIHLDEGAMVKAPLALEIVNGYILGGDGQTTMPAARIDEVPGSLRVRYAKGDESTATRTIVTVRNTYDWTLGFSFLPNEVVRHGIMRIPALGVVVTHRGSSKDFDSGYDPGASVYDMVAEEPEQTFARARREIPELEKTRQRPRPMYLPLGPPDARQEISVNYDASILLDRSALKSEAADSDRLHWPDEHSWLLRVTSGDPAYDHTSEGQIRQSLMEDWLPIVINEWSWQGIAYRQTCVATFLHEPADAVRGDETVVLLSRIEMRNETDQPTEAVLRFAAEPTETFALGQDGHVYARSRARDEVPEAYAENRYRFFLDAAAARVRPVGNDAGVPDAVLDCRIKLAANQQDAVTCIVPFVTLDQQAELDAIEALDFEQVVTAEAQRWRDIISAAATVEVPDKLLNDFYKAQLTHILITADRDPYNGTHILPAATTLYNVCLNESCLQIRALEIRGLERTARKFLDAIVAGQSSRGLHGRFTDREGVFHGLPAGEGDYQHFNYNLDHGFALWMLNEHYFFTRDRQWLASVAGNLVDACDFITRQSRVQSLSNTLGADDSRWGKGLLPPGHLEDPPEWLWWFAVNAYAYRGLAATAESLQDIEHPQAERIAADAEAFELRLRESCLESMVRAPVVRLRDGTYVPHQPTRSRLRGRDLGWIRDALYGPIHLIDCGIYEDRSLEAEWILRDAEDNVFLSADRGRAVDDFERQWFSWGGITLQSNLLPNPLIYLRRGLAKHAVRAFYNSLAANVYEDVRTFCEHPVEAYGIGQGPFFKSPDESAFIYWLRCLLVIEDRDSLHLLSGVPQEWLNAGDRIRFADIATHFGPVSLTAEVAESGSSLVVDLKGPTRNPPDQLVLHVRSAEKIRQVQTEDIPADMIKIEDGKIYLPGSVGSCSLTIQY